MAPGEAPTAQSKPFPWQQVVANFRDGWLEALGVWTRSLLETIRVAYRNAVREYQDNREALKAAIEKAKTVDPRFEISPWLVVIVVLAAVLGGVAAWRFVEAEVSGFVPVTAIASAVFAVIEVVLAGLLGRCIGALVLDKPNTPNSLDPPQRFFNRMASVIITGVLAVVAVLFAEARGEFLLWLAVVVAVDAAGVYLGLALYDQRHHRDVNKLEKKDRELSAEIDTWRSLDRKVQRAAMGNGRQLRGRADTILERASLSFRKAWRRWHPEEPVSPLPAIDRPSDEDLIQILFGKVAGDADGGPAGGSGGVGPSGGGEPDQPIDPSDPFTDEPDDPPGDVGGSPESSTATSTTPA